MVHPDRRSGAGGEEISNEDRKLFELFMLCREIVKLALEERHAKGGKQYDTGQAGGAPLYLEDAPSTLDDNPTVVDEPLTSIETVVGAVQRFAYMAIVEPQLQHQRQVESELRRAVPDGGIPAYSCDKCHEDPRKAATKAETEETQKEREAQKKAEKVEAQTWTEAGGQNRHEAQVTTSITLPEDRIPATCSICLAPFNAADNCRILPCHHIFHKECIDRWLKERSDICPLCTRPAIHPKPNRCSCCGRMC
ncbi:hypothetical protein FOZ62_023618 [Perkinsus olseni]|uniref:RING-type E3 ubiquitin transferase n=1 Tax=Perkinsus olseni TaxID=32597 RepID=A0A7J6RA53_PEROL|nr:hypothetical protein FOZ62_023618 [Perkinsus olseni]